MYPQSYGGTHERGLVIAVYVSC